MSASIQKMLCPRRSEGAPLRLPEHDSWRDGRTCSYCGSLHPDLVMERLEAGDAKLTPTDKGYKVYVLDQHQKPVGSPTGKFYFQHLSESQRTRFVELLNAKRLVLNFPGHFYVLPFFVRAGVA